MESITNGEFLLLTGQAVLDAMSDFQARTIPPTPGHVPAAPSVMCRSAVSSSSLAVNNAALQQIQQQQQQRARPRPLHPAACTLFLGFREVQHRSHMHR